MISKHISYKQGVHSNTAIRRGIDNTPTDDQLYFMEIPTNVKNLDFIRRDRIFKQNKKVMKYACLTRCR